MMRSSISRSWSGSVTPASLLAAACLVFGAPAHAGGGGDPAPGPACEPGQIEPLATETIALFNPDLLEAPTGIAIDSRDNKYVSLTLTGEIRKIAPDGTQSTFALLPLGGPPLTPCGPFFGVIGPLAIDLEDNLYVTLDSCDATSRGVWTVSPQGHAHLLATLPLSGLPHGLALRGGQIYVADSILSLVWRLPADGSGPATVWAESPLFDRPNGVFPGPTGVQFFGDELYVANGDAATVLAVELDRHDDAGAVRVHSSGTPCDDFAFDVLGNLYCGTDPFDTILRIAPDGTSEALLTSANELDGPTATLFGRFGLGHFELYIANAAYPFPGYSTAHRPSLMRTLLPIPGAPRP
jgi:hypothetical protein